MATWAPARRRSCGTCCTRWACRGASRARPTPWWSRTKLPGLAIWHFDFYRFNDPREWEDAGFRDLFAAEGLKMAEWPEKAAGLLPRADLVLRIEVLPDESRRVTLQAQTPLGRELLA